MELFACQRGCRLFSICQFVGESENLNQTKAECDSGTDGDQLETWCPHVCPVRITDRAFLFFSVACHEAYDEADEAFSCSLGCESQLPFAQQRQEQVQRRTNTTNTAFGVENTEKINRVRFICTFKWNIANNYNNDYKWLLTSHFTPGWASHYFLTRFLTFWSFFFQAAGHDAPNPPALPPDTGEGILGGHDEPSSWIHYFIMDLLPAGRWWESCCFPGK